MHNRKAVKFDVKDIARLVLIAGGLIFVGESISLRLAISASIIPGGILLVIPGQYYYVQRKYNS